MSFKVDFKTRWSDFDANIHMRHTAYNDYCAEARMRYFNKFGITVQDFAKEKVGPILFEENTRFIKEIHMGEDISVNLKIIGLSENGERWKVQNEVYNANGKLSAIITVYGAWLHLVKRKLTTPPVRFQEIFTDAEKTEDFKIIPLNK